MPRGKSHKKSKTDRETAHERAERSRRYASEIADELIAKASESELTQEEFNKAVRSLRKILADSHITGIANTAPKFGINALTGTHIIVKVSISTAKTRKTFTVRRGL